MCEECEGVREEEIIHKEKILSDYERMLITIEEIKILYTKLNRLPYVKEYKKSRENGYEPSIFKDKFSLTYSEFCLKYIVNNEKLEFKEIIVPKTKMCNICNEEKQKYDFYDRSNIFKKCTKMMLAIKSGKDLRLNEFKIIEQKCDICNEWMERDSNFSSERKTCSSCMAIEKKREAFEKRNIVMISDKYIDTKDNTLKWECPICKNEFTRAYNNVVNNGCLFCEECRRKSQIKKRKTIFEDGIKKALEVGCILMTTNEQWNNMNSPINSKHWFKCSKCKKEFYRSYGNVVNLLQNTCEECMIEKTSEDKKITEEEYKIRNDKILKNSNLEVITEYKDYNGIKSKVKVYCNKCKTIQEAEYYELYRDDRNYSCQNCMNKNIKVGEAKVYAELKTKGILFNYQQKFEDLKDKDYLRVDFYIPIDGINCGYILEVQSKLHREYVPFFHRNHQAFLDYIKRDNMKKSYFNNNSNYNLIYINEDSKTFEQDLDNLIKQILSESKFNKCKPIETKWTDVKAKISNGIPVVMYKADTGEYLNLFKSGVLEASEITKINYGSIQGVLSNRKKSARHIKGYVFKYVNKDGTYDLKIEPLKNVKTYDKLVCEVYNKKTNEIKEFENITLCAGFLNMKRTILSSYFSGDRKLPRRISEIYEISKSTL